MSCAAQVVTCLMTQMLDVALAAALACTPTASSSGAANHLPGSRVDALERRFEAERQLVGADAVALRVEFHGPPPSYHIQAPPCPSAISG